MKRIGVMTGGGDSSAINACLLAIVRRADARGLEVIGIRRGWAGLLERDTVPLTAAALVDQVHAGGTLIHTSRTNLFKMEGGPEKAVANIGGLGIDALIAIGGDDTLGVAHRLCALGAPAVGIPQTIDNDIGETDFAIGYDTAISAAVDGIYKVHSTNYSHRQDMLVEVMGRDAGWIAVMAAMAGGAHYVCLPEVPLDLAELCAVLQSRRQAGASYSLVVVSEGVHLSGAATSAEIDAFGHTKAGGIAYNLADAIKERTGVKPRVVVLGYLQRGGPPTAFDCVLGMRMGAKAVDLLLEGAYDRMVCARGGEIGSVELAKAVAHNRTVPLEFYELARQMCGLSSSK